MESACLEPLDEYRTRQAKWSAQQLAAQRVFVSIGNWRLAAAIAAAAIGWYSFRQNAVSPWWLLVPVLGFTALVVWHQRVIRRRTFAERAIRFYDEAIHRVEDSWSGRGSQGENFRDPEHIYSEDLDIFGRGSLFQLISNARTLAGEHALAKWLLAPASVAEVLDRQTAVKELALKLDLREQMALLGEDIKSSIHAGSLATWGSAVPVPFPAFLRVPAFVLALAGLAAIVLRISGAWPIWPLLAILVVNFGIMFLFRRQTTQVYDGIESAAHNLSLLSLLVERLEAERFESAGLKRLRDTITADGVPASQRIKQLDRWLELLDSSDHILLRVLGPVLLYQQQIVMAIEKWRSRNGQQIGPWIQALAEFEALSSFGALHYERPAWCFPALDASGEIRFSATELGHPLLPAAANVRNSLTLDQETRLLIVSGSNMSGKSTLLRAVGVNTVLAWAGSPVCAKSLQVSPLQTGASLRVSDSLQDNRSRFFAEINRLRQIVDLTHGAVPLLFLLDELLSGTNSHDRRIGAAGIVRGLLAGRTLGLLTTHDLALAQLDQDTGAAVKNVHFEDRIVGGKIEFDYHLRPGVVTHSNALELMRSIGLNI